MASPTACIWPYFNPRTREGCDFENVDGYNDVGTFISIHAPVKGATGDSSSDDNDDDAISIHAPVKGATTADCWH